MISHWINYHICNEIFHTSTIRKQWEKWYTWYTVRISKRKGRELSFCREKLNDLLNSRIPWWKFMGELQFQFKRLFRQGTSKSRLRFPFFFFSRKHYIYPPLSNNPLEFPFSSLSLSFDARRSTGIIPERPSVILSILFKEENLSDERMTLKYTEIRSTHERSHEFIRTPNLIHVYHIDHTSIVPKIVI